MDSAIGSIPLEVTVSLTALAILNHFLRTLLIHVDHVKIRIYIICWCMADNRWLKEHSCGEPPLNDGDMSGYIVKADQISGTVVGTQF